MKSFKKQLGIKQSNMNYTRQSKYKWFKSKRWQSELCLGMQFYKISFIRGFKKKKRNLYCTVTCRCQSPPGFLPVRLFSSDLARLAAAQTPHCTIENSTVRQIGRATEGGSTVRRQAGKEAESRGGGVKDRARWRWWWKEGEREREAVVVYITSPGWALACVRGLSHQSLHLCRITGWLQYC